MTDNFFGNYGFSLSVSSPLWFSEKVIHQIQPNILTDWSHETATIGGFKSASFTMQSSKLDVEEWINNGLGRDVQAFAEGGILVWEGFVDSIEAKLGSLTVKRGPLMEVANRVLVEYTPYTDITLDPPTTGDPTETTLAEDTDSQALFGIQEDIVSGGTLVDTATLCPGPVQCSFNEAEEIRDAYLQDHKYPEVSESISFGQSDTPQLTINCLGYYEWLDRYVYASATTGTVQIPTKIESILGADPNSIFSTSYVYINDEAHLLLLTPANSPGNRTALTQIEEMISQGDGNDNRTYFGVYEDRLCHFDSIPSEVEYFHRITTETQKVKAIGGSEIYPWRVRPAKWVHFPDFLSKTPNVTDLRYDPTNMFIESVKYTAPYGLELNGNKVSNVEQLLAKKGVGV